MMYNVVKTRILSAKTHILFFQYTFAYMIHIFYSNITKTLKTSIFCNKTAYFIFYFNKILFINQCFRKLEEYNSQRLDGKTTYQIPITYRKSFLIFFVNYSVLQKVIDGAKGLCDFSKHQAWRTQFTTILVVKSLSSNNEDSVCEQGTVSSCFITKVTSVQHDFL